MRRVAIVCGAGYVSGKEVMALELAQSLRERGYLPEVVCSFWGNGMFIDRVTNLGLPVQRLWLGFISATLRLDCIYMTLDQMRRWPRLMIEYLRFLRYAVPERVIHTNWHHLLLLWFCLKPERDLFWLHEVVPNKPQYRFIFGFLARRIQQFVPVSLAVAKSLENIGIESNKIHMIYNGIHDPSGHEMRRAAPSDCLRVGIIGQIGPWKGHEDLFIAFAAATRRAPMVELHVFGRGSNDYENLLKGKSNSLGIAEKIVWHGFVPERHAIFQSLDVCVVPSRFEEPFGLVALEAAFFGIPVIISRRGGLPEIVENEITGLVVEAQCPEQLADALCRLIECPHLRTFLGRNARRCAKERFSKERFADEFIRLLEASENA